MSTIRTAANAPRRETAMPEPKLTTYGDLGIAYKGALEEIEQLRAQIAALTQHHNRLREATCQACKAGVCSAHRSAEAIIRAVSSRRPTTAIDASPSPADVARAYRVICVSGDPALVLRSPDTTRFDEARAALDAGIDGHPHCDLLIGRWSGRLIEVCCTATRSNGLHHGSSHSADYWLDVSWLRLLALVGQDAVDRARIRSCWSRQLAHRLRHELGLEES